ncbi:unnamed protein product [Staurois parvus]|uniref:Secreted protein n=1 Tax=Staurois parvus TaxID=386267 RepID=A0ABN9ENA8_9NEOB|nr:unnamed protein product [Staurois parvus]
MTLGRKGLTSGVINGLTVCCVCFTRETCCFVSFCCAERNKTACPYRQERDLCCLHTDLSPLSFP